MSEFVIGLGGNVSFEWPAFNEGWKVDMLEQYFNSSGNFIDVRFDGCAVGLVASNGKLIMKPWRVKTTNANIDRVLSPKRCTCVPGSHAPCSGRETSRSERYTDEFARLVIQSCGAVSNTPLYNRDASHNRPVAAVAVDSQLSPLRGGSDFSYAGDDGCYAAVAQSSQNASTAHREKYEPSPYQYLGLVTRIIPANTAEFHSLPRKQALDKEVSRLRSSNVWNESTVAEWSDVRHIRKDGLPPMIGMLFPYHGAEER